MGKLKNELVGAIKTILRPVTKNFTYSYRFVDTPLKLKGGLGSARVKTAPSKEEKFIAALNFTNKVAYDIGGHLGIFAVYLGKSVSPGGQVFSFEPNPECFRQINEHLKLNEISNVQVFNVGIADEKKSRTLTVRKHLSATGSMEEHIQSDILKEKGSRMLQVQTDSLDSIIREKKLPAPDFIKIDIEGMEYPALLGMAETLKTAKPELYIEIHGAGREIKSKNIRQIVGFLKEYDYSILHVESETEITSENAEVAMEGHIYCN